jgi:hypothetical protein
MACVQGGEGDIDPSVRKDKDGGSFDETDQEPDDGTEATPGEAGDETTAPEETGADAEPSDSFLPPDDGGCTPTCTTCGASDGCGGTCATGACGGGATCVSGACVAPTRSHLSPADYAFGSGWAKGITWTLASEESANIVYTLDGSTPGPGSASKPSPVDLFLSTSGTVIKWYADNGAKEPTIHSFTANIDTSGQSKYGFIVDKVSLGGKGPVIVVSPGAKITGNASYQAWNSSGCPMCRYQLVYGVETTSAGCLYDWSPDAWPGASGSAPFTVTAPSSAGTYKLQVSYTLQTSCANGMATNPIGARPTAQIGTIVVK